MYDIIIIGMGISGITAGIYAKRSNKKVLLIDKGMPGGLLNNIDKISNYPGLIDISGPDFAEILNVDMRFIQCVVKSIALGMGSIKMYMDFGGYYVRRDKYDR